MELGFALYQLGRYEEALEFYREAAKLQPEGADAHAGVGWSLLELDRDGEAVEAFERALEIDPRHESAKKGLALAGEVVVEMALYAVGLWGVSVPSTSWGVGGGASLAVTVDSWRPRLAYRYARLQPVDSQFTPMRPSGNRTTAPGTNSHFAAVGLDLLDDGYQLGLLGGGGRGRRR